MTKLQVGLIGCGRWGRHILRDLLSLECDVTVVASSEAGRQNARDGGATKVVEHIGHLPKSASEATRPTLRSKLSKPSFSWLFSTR